MVIETSSEPPPIAARPPARHIDTNRINVYTCCVSTQLIFISVAARMLDMHPQTLRKYQRLGLVRPARTIGSMRLYSPRRSSGSA